MQPISAFALLAALAAGPALAQDYPRYPDQPETSGGVLAVPESEQEAMLPAEEPKSPAEVETFRSDHMSAPNVAGDTMPKHPGTGLPVPEDSKRPESGPRP